MTKEDLTESLKTFTGFMLVACAMVALVLKLSTFVPEVDAADWGYNKICELRCGSPAPVHLPNEAMQCYRGRLYEGMSAARYDFNEFGCEGMLCEESD